MLGLAGLAFAACGNEDDPGSDVNNGNQTVRITLSRGTMGTRAVEGTAVGGYNTIRSLSICFYSADDQIVYRKDLDATADKEFFDGVNSNDIPVHQEPYTISNVPGNAKRIYIIANEPTTKINTQSWDDVKGSTVKLEEMITKRDGDTFSGQSAVLTGYKKNINENSVTTDGVTTVSVDVKLIPVSSRFEIDGFVCNNAPTDYTGSEVSSFVVTGVYMNNFYPTGSLDPDLDNDNRSQISAENKEEFTATSNEYKNYTFMLDENKGDNGYQGLAGYQGVAETGAIWKYTRSDNQILGYPLLQGDIPHIVIRMNVIFEGDSDSHERFLTIQKFKVDPASSGITWDGQINRGYAYKITNLAFDPSNLEEIPYEGKKSVVATISVSPWTGVPLQPDFN